MANKNKKSKEKPIVNYMELLYMTSGEVRAKEIAMHLQTAAGLKVEVWDEMNVLELGLPSQNIVDFEPLDISFPDPSDAAFIKNRSIQTIFAIRLVEDDFDVAKPYFEQIVAHFSGFICADSVDFQPIYVGSAEQPK